jgi:hypothetical protein
MNTERLKPSQPVSTTIKTNPTQITSNGLLIYLDAKNYSGSGTTWPDSSGNNNNATIVNSPTFVSAGDASYFNMVTANSTHFTLPTNSFDLVSNGFTYFGVADFGNVNDYERLMDFGGGSASDNILFFRNASTTTCRAEIYIGSSMLAGIEIPNGIISGMAFYAFRCSGSTLSIWSNSIKYTSDSIIKPRIVSRTNNYLGRSNWANAYFDTKYAAFGLWNRGLSDEEIYSVYSVYKDRYGLA